MRELTRRRRSILVLLAALLVTLVTTSAPALAADGRTGVVYTLTNSASRNEVVVFQRAADGTLTPSGRFATEGRGTGAGLGSQGAVVLSSDDRWLLAVNAGSNEISSFAVTGNGLLLRSTVDSSGVKPISVTVADDLVYALNGGDDTTPPNIAGFRLRPNGSLAAIRGSSRPLSAPNADPAQIQFGRDGRVLVVTEKATNLIDTYVVGSRGRPTGPSAHPSAGETPFGFAFDGQAHVIVSDAFGGRPGESALSSYEVGNTGTLTTITPLAPDGQTAACWVVIAKHGRFAYTTNTGSANISSYTVASDGSLSLLNAVAGSTGAGPIDAAVSSFSRYLYTLDSGSHGISAFAVADDGSLAPLPGTSGLPDSAVGLAAR
jgi:6-phosphogluconolactonase (cycloisomerase 2 family)